MKEVIKSLIVKNKLMRITIVYDNNSEGNCIEDWGFACLIERKNEHILFDTGANLNILLHNLKTLAIDPAKIKKIVFSHEHWDHTGGKEIIQFCKDVEVYVPKSFSHHFKNSIRKFDDAELHEVKEVKELSKGIYSTGELDSPIKEQSLAVETNEGLLIITGCSHPGLDRIIEFVEDNIGKVYGVLGGFHGFNALEKLKKLKLIVPCHCTIAKKRILQLYEGKTKKCYAGLRLEI